MIACFEAKYHYWFWRPYQAIPRADTDGNPATEPDPTWVPLRPAPNFPEYVSAHASHSAAVARALEAFFGTDTVSFFLDSRVTQTTREYASFLDIVKDVNQARVLAEFHFRNSDQEGRTSGAESAVTWSSTTFNPLIEAVSWARKVAGRKAAFRRPQKLKRPHPVGSENSQAGIRETRVIHGQKVRDSSTLLGMTWH
jgi:hypothetical protein